MVGEHDMNEAQQVQPNRFTADDRRILANDPSVFELPQPFCRPGADSLNRRASAAVEARASPCRWISSRRSRIVDGASAVRSLAPLAKVIVKIRNQFNVFDRV